MRTSDPAVHPGRAFGKIYFNTIMVEGIVVAVGMAAICLWLASCAFLRENA